MTGPGGFEDSDENLEASDSDVSLVTDSDDSDNMGLIKSKGRQRKEGGAAVLSSHQRTPEEIRQLELMKWNKKF